MLRRSRLESMLMLSIKVIILGVLLFTMSPSVSHLNSIPEIDEVLGDVFFNNLLSDAVPPESLVVIAFGSGSNLVHYRGTVVRRLIPQAHQERICALQSSFLG